MDDSSISKYFKQGDYSKVISIAKALDIEDEKNVESIKIAALAHMNMRQYQEAIHYFEKLLALNNNDPTLYNSLGVVYLEAKNWKCALRSFLRALKINKNYVDGIFNLALLYHRTGKDLKAIAQYKNVTALQPTRYDALNNLGNLYANRNVFIEAEKYYRQAINVKTDYAEAHYNLGNLKAAQGQISDAIDYYRESLSYNPANIQASLNLANSLVNVGKDDEAEEVYNRLLVLKGNYAPAYNNLGTLLLKRGCVEDARDQFSKAIALDNNYMAAHQNLSQITKYNSKHHHLKVMLSLNEQKTWSDEERCLLSFALAKAYEDSRNYKSAFEKYEEGNALRKKSLRYNIVQDRKLFGSLIRIQSQFDEVRAYFKNSFLTKIPVFIVGMPRSGTTLVEAIISKHSRICAAGELPVIGRLAHKFFSDSGIIDEGKITKFRNKYLKYISEISTEKTYLVDKMPQNFRYVPLIQKAFPEAKIIHVFRDPAATCWSNFKHNFSASGLGYSCNLNDTVTYYELYNEMMCRWHQISTRNIINIDYEQLVRAPTTNIKNLVYALNCAWEDKLLDSTKSGRLISTSSQLQVRQPIYSDSSENWKRYERYIGEKLLPLYSLRKFINLK